MTRTRRPACPGPRKWRRRERAAGRLRPSPASLAPGPHGIGWAIDAMHDDLRVRRSTWETGMFVEIAEPTAESSLPGAPWVQVFIPDDGPRSAMLPTGLPHGTFVPWVATHADLMWCDWELAEPVPPTKPDPTDPDTTRKVTRHG